MEKTIVAFYSGKGEFPWRVKVDGHADPRNRDFEGIADVRETYAILQAEGFYLGYTVIANREK